MIRKATQRDLSRIAEILVFVKRIKFRPIFQDDDYSFGELQVLDVVKRYDNPELLSCIYVYDDSGIVKGFIHVDSTEIVTLYVDDFFQGQGIGSKLIRFALEGTGATFLWALEKNEGAIRFYERHGFRVTGERKLEEGTTEYLVKMERTE
ncbi:MAG: GNAT family N-acetyltransferase [Atopobiaceae bacterium]|nr:GNAT family N-acetyltransferase [Atopobiaceae bacterium]